MSDPLYSDEDYRNLQQLSEEDLKNATVEALDLAGRTYKAARAGQLWKLQAVAQECARRNRMDLYYSAEEQLRSYWRRP